MFIILSTYLFAYRDAGAAAAAAGSGQGLVSGQLGPTHRDSAKHASHGSSNSYNSNYNSSPAPDHAHGHGHTHTHAHSGSSAVELLPALAALSSEIAPQPCVDIRVVGCAIPQLGAHVLLKFYNQKGDDLGQCCVSLSGLMVRPLCFFSPFLTLPFSF